MTNTDMDVFSVDDHLSEPMGTVAPPQPLYRIYEGSRVAVGKGVGQVWKNRYDAAIKAYQEVYDCWDEVFRYYNNNQAKTTSTPKGQFARGDNTENVVYSNINIMLPAVYSKDPNITCSTSDNVDQPFCDALQSLINTLFKKKDMLNAKHKIKRASGLALLTNFGVLKLDFVTRDESRDLAVSEIRRLSDELSKAKEPKEVEKIYGQIEALEMQMEILQQSGPTLSNILPRNLIIDPNAEMPDGTDAMWMVERCYISTAALNALYTKPKDEGIEEEDEGGSPGDRVLVYKPTHKANFTAGSSNGSRDDGLGVVMDRITSGGDNTEDTDDARKAYQNMYYTECYYVWDRALRRVMLFHCDDWTWPLWVWDDPLRLTRFFPFYIIAYTMSTGGTVTVGETSYYLDHQDTLNQINREVSRIRRAVFNNFYYNSDKVDDVQAQKFVDALRKDDVSGSRNLLGVRAGDSDIDKIIQAFAPPAIEYEALFNREQIFDTINRITNTSDALRGVQFKTNTNVASVTSYMESMKLSVGAKVDVIEDVVADMAGSLAELCIQKYDQQIVAGLIGDKLAEGWKQMSLEQFNASYSLEVVAGSMEKPNSVFKKKEAVQIAQAVGQFAQSAPTAVLTIVLKVLEKAFSDVVITKEDWDMIKNEALITAQKGVSTEAGVEGQGQPTAGQNIVAMAQQLPPQVKQQIMQMRDQGAPPEQIIEYIKQQAGGQGGGPVAQSAPPPQPTGAPNGSRAGY